MRLPERARFVLCDADGTLFPSEEPAFEASAVVVNRALEDHGLAGDLTGERLRRAAAGRAFRSLLPALLADAGRDINEEALERWVRLENTVVTRRLRTCLRPQLEVRAALKTVAARVPLALVSSSSLSRLDACLLATGLDDLLPEQRRFSAQDSPPRPTSKPDPDVYRLATAALGVAPADAVAVEDAVSGVQSAVGAGVPVIGLTAFVPAEERPARARALCAAGAVAVVGSWPELSRTIAALALEDASA